VSHLSAEELIDLAEGEQPESGATHLASCAECRASLAELRAMLAMTAAVDVPEPSPLFWDHFSTRVAEAVAADRTPAAAPRRWFRLLGPAMAALALLVAAVLFLRAPSGGSTPPSTTGASPMASTAADSPRELLNDSTIVDDPSLALVADLVADIGLDGASEAGMTTVDTAEHAVTHMNSAELDELRRILQH